MNLVDLNKANLGKAREGIMKNLEYQVELGVLKRDRIPEIMANLSFCDTLAEGVKEVDLVEEAVFENLELKQKLFGELEALVGEMYPGLQPPSFISTTCMDVKHKERSSVPTSLSPVITPAWKSFLPTHREQVVETGDLVPDTLARLSGCKSGPGFVANRIQYGWLAEASHP